MCLCLPGFSDHSPNIYNRKWDQNTSPALTLTFSRIPFQGKLAAFHRCFTGFGDLRKQKPIKFRPKLARTRGPKKPHHAARRSVSGTALVSGWQRVGPGRAADQNRLLPRCFGRQEDDHLGASCYEETRPKATKPASVPRVLVLDPKCDLPPRRQEAEKTGDLCRLQLSIGIPSRRDQEPGGATADHIRTGHGPVRTALQSCFSILGFRLDRFFPWFQPASLSLRLSRTHKDFKACD